LLLMSSPNLPVVVIGAGPVGMSAAVQLLHREIDVLVLEAGSTVAASVRDWGHVRLFSPWRFNVDKVAARFLESEGWTPPPPDDLPTGSELHRRYLKPLAELPQLRSRIRFDQRVTGITRLTIDKTNTKARGDGAFLVRSDDADILARAVIDASGTWRTPNPLGASGLAARGEAALAHRIHYGTMRPPLYEQYVELGATTCVSLSGSLRASSSNAAIVRAIARLVSVSDVFSKKTSMWIVGRVSDVAR
jgi:cation diffusion facilitator CzcD-associated flavoprotein CzcO